MRYEETAIGTIVNHETGLEWQAEATSPMTWDEAMKYAESLGDGWRLPSRPELESLLNLEQFNPASDFPGMPVATFWSSSVIAGSTSYAWIVYFGIGNVYSYDKGYDVRVRCVRRKPRDGRFDSLAEAEARIAELEAQAKQAKRERDAVQARVAKLEDEKWKLSRSQWAFQQIAARLDRDGGHAQTGDPDADLERIDNIAVEWLARAETAESCVTELEAEVERLRKAERCTHRGKPTAHSCQ